MEKGRSSLWKRVCPQNVCTVLTPQSLFTFSSTSCSSDVAYNTPTVFEHILFSFGLSCSRNLVSLHMYGTWSCIVSFSNYMMIFKQHTCTCSRNNIHVHKMFGKSNYHNSSVHVSSNKTLLLFTRSTVHTPVANIQRIFRSNILAHAALRMIT